jgi:hypothetical protein
MWVCREEIQKWAAHCFYAAENQNPPWGGFGAPDTNGSIFSTNFLSHQFKHDM